MVSSASHSCRTQRDPCYLLSRQIAPALRRIDPDAAPLVCPIAQPVALDEHPLDNIALSEPEAFRPEPELRAESAPVAILDVPWVTEAVSMRVEQMVNLLLGVLGSTHDGHPNFSMALIALSAAALLISSSRLNRACLASYASTIGLSAGYGLSRMTLSRY